MRKSTGSVAFLTGALAAAVLVSAPAYACGESLFRVGKGISYRAHTAPLPGNVIVVAQTQAHKDFAERLAAAGHNVRTVEDASMLAAALEEADFDVVLASFSDRDVVAEQFAATSSHAAYLPVTAEASEQELARDLYEKPLAESDDFRTFLKAIHRTLKRA